MLSLKDLLKIENIVDEKLNEKLDEKLKFLPTKEEFFTRMDQLSGEIKTMREESAANNLFQSNTHDQLENHEDRIAHVEQKLKITSLSS